MNRSDVSLTFALCASLVLHAVLSLALAEAYVRDAGGRIWLPGLGRAAAAEAEAPLPRFDFQEDPRRRLGDVAGTGYAIDESPGAQPMRARDGALDQPMLSRDPVGPGRVGNEPSEWTLPPGAGGASGARELPAPTFASPPAEAQVVGIQPSPPREEPPTVAANAEQRADVIESTEGDAARSTAQTPPPQPAAAMTAPAPSVGAAADAPDAPRPGPRTSADPAPKGESEIDPVSVGGAMDFRTGSTTVRAGRKHRIVRPRLTLDAKLDLVSLGSTYLILRLRLDAAGNVTSSEVARSSGSASLDQVFKVTSYEWWFDPARDASSNRPVPDDFQFIIRIN
jgi:outer membrane biosynthesis protein TonB